MSMTEVHKEIATYVPIYNKDGEAIEAIPIHDRLTYISGRVCKGESGVYYKGAGCLYSSHHVLNPNGYDNPTPASVFYYGYKVSNPAWKGKYGIFLQKMQPYFSDLAGACGPKELKLITNSRKFDKSSVEVINVAQWTPEHKGQYLFTLNYLCGRKKFSAESDVRLLISLIEYMTSENWCVPWDKGFISDVTDDGRVSDVADMFISEKKKHKLGTAWSLLHSLWVKQRDKFKELCETIGWSSVPSEDGFWAGIYIVAMAAMFIGEFRNTPPRKTETFEIAEAIMEKLLLRGRNCAGVENPNNSKYVSKLYLKRYRRILNAEKNIHNR